MFGFHTLQADPQRSQALVAGVRILPFAEREDPKPTRVISPDGRPWTGDQPTGIDYGGRLHEVYQSEPRRVGPVLPGHAQATGHRAGQPFTQTKGWQTCSPGRPSPGSSRPWPTPSPSASRDGGTGRTGSRTPRSCSAPQLSARPARRAPRTGAPVLRGGQHPQRHEEPDTWRGPGVPRLLHRPGPHPGWTAVATTACTSRPTRSPTSPGPRPCRRDQPLPDRQRPQRDDRGSRDSDLITNDDSPGNLLFGPTAPKRKEANRVQTIPTRHWLSHFRFYGPLEPPTSTAPGSWATSPPNEHGLGHRHSLTGTTSKSGRSSA